MTSEILVFRGKCGNTHSLNEYNGSIPKQDSNIFLDSEEYTLSVFSHGSDRYLIAYQSKPVEDDVIEAIKYHGLRKI